MLPPSARAGYAQLPDWTYSPVKNSSVDEARAKLEQGAPGRSATEGELEFYDAGCKALAAAGVALQPYADFSVFGFALKLPPRVVFHPNFAVSFAAIVQGQVPRARRRLHLAALHAGCGGRGRRVRVAAAGRRADDQGGAGRARHGAPPARGQRGVEGSWCRWRRARPCPTR